MKNTDIAMIILVASLGVIVAYVVASNLSFLKLPDSGVKVQTIRKISSDVTQPSKDIFNDKAINPTVEVIVGGENG